MGLNKLLAGLTIGLLIGAGALYVVTRKTPLERLYEDYNHITMYEDGTYKAERHNNMVEVGCIKGGLCEDY